MSSASFMVTDKDRHLNNYFGLCIGQNKADVLKIIPDIMARDYAGGLTLFGAEQIVQHCVHFKEQVIHPIIMHSDYFEARQTAQIAQKIFEGTTVFTSSLAERSMGNLVGRDAYYYTRIWAQDGRDPLHTDYSVESIMKISERVGEFFWSAESSYSKANIILVGSSDVLSVFNCLYRETHLRFHRQFKFESGEMRRFEGRSL